MTSIGDLSVTFSANLDGLTAGIEKAKSQLSSVGSAAEDTSGTVEESGSRMGGLWNAAVGGVMMAATNLAVQGLGKLKDGIVDSVQVAMANQQIMAQTAQAIKSTGDASGLSADQVAKMAESLSGVTEFSKPAIQQGENLLLTFTGIGKKTFPDATKAMLDLSQATGQSLTSSAMQLGKALNDPLTGMSALQRVGVSFSASEKESIKTMMAHNDVAGAQAVMLKELQTEFGGSAEAAGKTFGGQLDILKNNLENVKEKIGSALLPVLSTLVTNFASPILQALPGIFDKIGGAIQTVSGFLTGANGPLSGIGSSFKGLLPDIQSIAGLLSGAFQTGLDVVQNLFKAIQPGLQDTASILGGQLKSNMAFVGNLFNQIGQWIQTTFLPALAQLQPPFDSIAASISSNVLPALATLWATGQQVEQAVLTPLIGILENIIPPLLNIAGFLGGVLAAGFKIVSPLAKGLADAISGLFNFFTKTQVGGDLLKATLIALAIPVGIITIGFIALAIQGIAAFIMSIPGMVGGFIAGAAGAWSMAAGVIALTWPILAVIAVIALIILAIQNWGTIVAWLQMIWGHVAQFFQNDVAKPIGSLFSGLGSLVHGICNDIGGAFSGLGTIAHNIWNGIVGSIKGAINDIIGGINSFINMIDGIQIHIPSIGVGPIHSPAFNWNGLGIPDIPKLSTGGTIPSGGMAIVGDPTSSELVMGGSAGATVFSHAQSQAILNLAASSASGRGNGSSPVIHVHNYIDGQEMSNIAGQQIIKNVLAYGPVRSWA